MSEKEKQPLHERMRDQLGIGSIGHHMGMPEAADPRAGLDRARSGVGSHRNP